MELLIAAAVLVAMLIAGLALALAVRASARAGLRGQNGGTGLRGQNGGADTSIVARSVDDVRAELRRLEQLVGQLRSASSQQHGTLVENLRHVTETNAAVAQHTDALRRALANPKERGQWGERMADDVLAAAGMVEGINYRRQSAVDGGTIPDFRFLLPQDIELRMDVKFPVDNYLRAVEAEDDAARARHTKAFVRDVRDRIRELDGRGYVDARDTVDCLLLFIPNEAVYTFLHRSDPEVIDVALAHKVVLCSPSTLFAVLAVVRQSVEQFRLERVSDEILRCLGGVRDEWDRFGSSLDKLGRQLDSVTRTFADEVNGTRRRVFDRALAEVDRLRAPETPRGEGAGERLVAEKSAGDVRPLVTPAQAGVVEPATKEQVSNANR